MHNNLVVDSSRGGMSIEMSRRCHTQFCDAPDHRQSDSKMSKRPLNDLETKLHQAALASPKNVRVSTTSNRKFRLFLNDQELSVKQAEAIIPDPSARQNALNFLLSVGLFKSLVDVKGAVSFRAVTKGELTACATRLALGFSSVLTRIHLERRISTLMKI